MVQKRELKPIVSTNLSDAVEKILVDAVDAGVDLEQIEDNPKSRGKLTKSGKELDELVSIKSRGSAIPGQSLTNNPDQPYPWESQPEFTNPKEALDSITTDLLKPQVVDNVVKALSNGASVGDIAISILYTKFIQGKINPDLMLLSVEPVMYIIMAIGEEANIQYNIDGDDIDEEDETEVAEKVEEFRNIVDEIQNGVSKNKNNIDKVSENVMDKNLLDRVKEAGPEIRKNLLDKGE